MTGLLIATSGFFNNWKAAATSLLDGAAEEGGNYMHPPPFLYAFLQILAGTRSLIMKIPAFLLQIKLSTPVIAFILIYCIFYITFIKSSITNTGVIFLRSSFSFGTIYFDDLALLQVQFKIAYGCCSLAHPCAGVGRERGNMAFAAIF